jgi:hypothetical protein
MEKEYHTGEKCHGDQGADDAAYDEAGLVILVVCEWRLP